MAGHCSASGSGVKERDPVWTRVGAVAARDRGSEGKRRGALVLVHGGRAATEAVAKQEHERDSAWEP